MEEDNNPVFTDKVTYLISKLDNEEPCRKITLGSDKLPCTESKDKNVVLCNVCWWKSVQKDPRTDDIPFCSYCVEDTEKFTQALYKLGDEKFMSFVPRCVRVCTWWDWFDFKRVNLAKESEVEFIYRRWGRSKPSQ